jgi:5'-nucleotidase
MRILVTNDDGIRSPGLHALIEVAKTVGDVKVVAPDRERSACAHAMTLYDPLRMKEVSGLGVEAWEASGVPTDCVNLGLTVCWPDGCDLILSGINNGPNLGFDVTYSGTVAGAMEGIINGIRLIAVSMALFVSDAPLHYETGGQWLRENIHWLAALDLPDLTLLNVNIPAIAYPELVGYRFCAMGRRVYQDRLEQRSDPWGRPYYWQGGVVVMHGDQPETDVSAVSEGFVSITPIRMNWTDDETLRNLKASH